MVWVQVLLGGVALVLATTSIMLAFLTVFPILLGVLFWIFRKNILGQWNAEAKEEIATRVEAHIKPSIDAANQLTDSIEKRQNELMKEFEAAVPASTLETLSPERLSHIYESRRRFEDFQALSSTEILSAEYYFKQGNAFSFEKKHENAINSYDQAIQLKPDYAEAWYFRGITLRMLNITHIKAL
jgi:tetratricopeptide (TPR) repeat protein